MTYVLLPYSFSVLIRSSYDRLSRILVTESLRVLFGSHQDYLLQRFPLTVGAWESKTETRSFFFKVNPYFSLGLLYMSQSTQSHTSRKEYRSW